MNESFEDVLAKYGELTYTNHGTSMLPMLRPERDVFTVVRKGQDRCKENDVVLFKRDGRYVLHRIVEVQEDAYTILGDNCVSYERNVKDEDILGVLVRFYRNRKVIEIDNCFYRFYVKQLRLFERPRIWLKRFFVKAKASVKDLLLKLHFKK